MDSNHWVCKCLSLQLSQFSYSFSPMLGKLISCLASYHLSQHPGLKGTDSNLKKKKSEA